ncbi:MAG: carboxylesterase family protein [Burkholderiaceae bacterium]
MNEGPKEAQSATCDVVSPGRRRALQSAALGLGTLAAPWILTRGAHAAASLPVVETRSGKIQGEEIDGVEVFKAIPYGDSTSGANRFLPPRPVQPWSGVKPTRAFGASAPQPSDSPGPTTAWYSTIMPVSEDCLFLNVFAPAERRSSAQRPVMVWLHGGGWWGGSGTAPGFDGTRLARDGDVVVVTLNHRLNAFGYLYFGKADPRFADSGNAGILDLVAALHWVKDNITLFGGNPRNVTIFGQSGGAAKVAALMDMPAAKGLFHRAIVESCSGGTRLDGPEEAAKQTELLATALGMSRPDPVALQAVPMQTLIGAMRAVKDPYRPVLDGRSFLQDPFEPRATPLAAAVPTLIGNAATEMTLYLAADPRNFSIGAPEVHQRLSRLFKLDDANTDRIIATYTEALGNPQPSDVLDAIGTDYVFRRNTLRIAALQSEQAPVYSYLFDWETPVMGGVLHSPHTVEVPFVFGTYAAASGLVGNGRELGELSRSVMAAWAAFAHSGTPDTPGLPSWPQYRADSRSVMLLNTQSRIATDPGGVARAALDHIPPYEYNVDRGLLVHS